jgi:hypothetical protein
MLKKPFSTEETNLLIHEVSDCAHLSSIPWKKISAFSRKI